MTHKMSIRSLLVALALITAPQLNAGLLQHFKNLVDQTGVAVENYNKNMWTGDASLGKTAINSVKAAAGQKGVKAKFKGLNDAVDKIAAAQTNAQNVALTDVKAVLNTLKEIALYLPKKLQAIFNKGMDKIRAFIKRLGELNQGDTVKARWANLTGGAAAGGGDAGGGDAASFAEDFGDGDLADALDGPAAPHASQSFSDLDGAFGKMLAASSKLKGKKLKKARNTIQASYLQALQLAFERDSREAAKALWAEAPALFRSAPQKMQRSIENMAAQSGSALAKQFSKAAKRLSKSAKIQAQVQ
jgi:hypothetical protein